MSCSSVSFAFNCYYILTEFPQLFSQLFSRLSWLLVLLRELRVLSAATAVVSEKKLSEKISGEPRKLKIFACDVSHNDFQKVIFSMLGGSVVLTEDPEISIQEAAVKLLQLQLVFLLQQKLQLAWKSVEQTV